MTSSPPSWTSLSGVPSSTPTDDPDCPLCISSVPGTYRHDPFSLYYRVGEIISIEETVHAPIDEAFANAPGAVLKSPAVVDTSSHRKVRPAVVCEEDWLKCQLGRAPWPTPIKVYLLTSYGGIHTSKFLPKILKEFFAIPVSRHCEISMSDVHVHMCPEWPKDNTWLIAYPIMSPGESVWGRWEWRDSRGNQDK